MDISTYATDNIHTYSCAHQNCETIHMQHMWHYEIETVSQREHLTQVTLYNAETINLWTHQHATLYIHNCGKNKIVKLHNCEHMQLPKQKIVKI